MKIDRKIFYISILLAITIWVIDAFTDSIYFVKEPFLSALILKLPAHEIFGRLVSFVIVLVFGIFISRMTAKLKAAESNLAKAKNELEIRVAERTSELRHANQSLQASEIRLRNLSLQILTAQEMERREISRELHDEFGQALAFLKQRLWRAQNKLKAEEADVADEIKESLQNVSEVIENVRRISQNLSPHILEYAGLSVALQKLINDFSKHYNINVRAELTNVDHAIPKESHVVIYRIFQEALNNIAKHASASHLSAIMKNGDKGISFLIEDNGKGFDVNHTILGNAFGRGLGLAILDERVKMLGGRLDLWSKEGKGTRIFFSIPVNRTTTG